MKLSTDERRALAIIAALLVLASGARWLERPRPLLADVPGLDIAALEEASRAAQEESGQRPAPAKPSASNGRSSLAGRSGPGIDPNTASAAELDALPGVGPALAARIVDERERAPFTSVADLTRVRGIGAALANTLAAHVTLPAVSSGAGPGVSRGLTPVETAPPQASGTGPVAPTDLNEISSADLQKVRGVGPVLAGRIIARRDSIGRFASWAQVDEVAGVGPAMLSRLRESLVLRP
jgi:competence protein ComEA